MFNRGHWKLLEDTEGGPRVVSRNGPDDNWLSAISDRYKIVFSPKEGDEPWLFDLEKDTDELINFYNNPDYKDIRTWMSAQQIEYGEKTKDSLPL